MPSRRTPRQLLVAVLLGVLIGGGLMAITPAGAEVSQAARTSWKKIWKNNLKPLADKRYYTKKQSDTTFSTKSESASASGAAVAAAKAASDAAATAAAAAAGNSATDAKLGGYYTKAQADTRFRSTALIQGLTVQYVTATAANQVAATDISFGATLSAVPTVHYIKSGMPNPDGCPGSADAPNASAGHLCIWEVFATNNDGQAVTAPDATLGAAKTGVLLITKSQSWGQLIVTTAWAVRPLG